MKRGGPLKRKTELRAKTRLASKQEPPAACSCGGGLPSDGDQVCNCGSSWTRGDDRKAKRATLGRSGPIVAKPRSARVGAASGLPKPVNDFSPAVRARVRKRSGGACELAGCRAEATDHHHRRRRGAGPQTALNDAHLCHADHMRAHGNPEWARRRGLIVRSTEDPALKPMLTDAGWVLLADDGSVAPVEIGAVA